VVPLRAGGGTRLKNTRSYGLWTTGSINIYRLRRARGVDGEHLLIGDSPEDFAQNVIQLLLEPDLRHRITIAARRMVEQRYDWPIIGRKLLRIYVRLQQRALRLTVGNRPD